MTILFGHPTGNPNSHNAALAHWEAGRLESFCVPWMPSQASLRVMRALPLLRGSAERLSRRSFTPLQAVPTIQGRCGELRRLSLRALGKGDEGLSYEANDWVMRTMARECARPRVTALHAYEDAALWAFEAARKLDKACLYDMPIGYYPAWEDMQRALAVRFADWLPGGRVPSSRWVRPQQKMKEMALADLVLAPSSFVKATIQDLAAKRIAVVPYGVDAGFWAPGKRCEDREDIRFIFAGQCSVRKGIPILLEAWRAAGLKHARLDLVGPWQLSEERRSNLPAEIRLFGPLAAPALRQRFQAADVLVFPSFFDGFGLVILEAMACGLPVIASDASAGPDILDAGTGRIVPRGSLEGLVESLRWFDANRAKLPNMKRAARASAERWSWVRYREQLGAAVAEFQ